MNVNNLTLNHSSPAETRSQLPDENLVMAEIGRIVNSANKIEDVYQQISDQINLLIPFDRLRISLVDQELNLFRTVFISGLQLPDHNVGSLVPPKGSPALKAIQTKQVQIIQGLGETEIEQSFPNLLVRFKAGLRSFMLVPLFQNTNALGTLGIFSRETNAFSTNHSLIGELIAIQLSGAIASSKVASELSRAEEGKRRLVEENSVISEIGRLINSSLVLEDIFEQLGIQIQKLIPFDRIRVNLLDTKSESMKIMYISGIEFEGHSVGDSVPLKESASYSVMQSGLVSIVQGMSAEQLAQIYPSLVPTIEHGLLSSMIVPLTSDDTVKGTIGLLSRKESAYTENDGQTAARIASLVSGAIINARLYAERAEAEAAQRLLAEENLAIAEIGRIISSSIDISEVYSQFGEVVRKLVPCDRIAITTIDTANGETSTDYAWGTEIVNREPGKVFKLKGTITGDIISNQLPLTRGVVGSSKWVVERDLTQRQENSGVKSLIGVPLRTQNETAGVLLVQSLESNIYQDRHVRLLGIIADQIAGAVLNSRLYSKVTKSEESLRNSENKLKALFESASSGIVTINGLGVIESLNHEAEVIFGYEPLELIGKNVSQLMPDSFKEGHHAHLSNYLSTGKSTIIGANRELFGLRKDGTTFPMELVVREVEIDGQQSFTGIVRDTTERVEAQESVQRLATIVESANDAIYAYGLDQRFTVWNKAAATLYDYSAEEMLGQPISLITPPELDASRRLVSESALAGNSVVPYETRKIAKGGKIIDIVTSGSPILDSDGRITGVVAIQRDITEQKKIEKALRESEDRLNARLLEEKNRAEEIQIRKSQNLQTIFEIAAALTGPADFHTKTREVTSIIREKLDADSVALRVLDEQAGTLNFIAEAGSRLVGLPDKLPLDGTSFSQQAFREGRSISIGDYTKIIGATPEAISNGLRSICSIGLLGPDGPNGLLNISSRHPNHFNEERVELLESIAFGIAELIESARLSEELNQSRKEIDVTDGIARIITSTLDIDEAYEDFFAEIGKLVEFDIAAVVLRKGDSPYGIFQYVANPSQLPYEIGYTFAIRGSLLERVSETKQCAYIPDLTLDSTYKPSARLVEQGILSIMVTPLIIEDKVIGQFSLYSCDKHAFGDRERVILERLASHVAPSIRNATLHQEADQFGLALDSIGEAVAFLDSDLTIRYVNRSFEQTYGYTASEARGKSVTELTADYRESKLESQEILQQGNLEGWSGEVQRSTKSGKVIDILLTVAPVKNKTGEVIGRVSVSRDITETKKTAAHLNEENRLAAVGELAAGVAHEINNPLTNILLASQMIAESDVPDETLADLTVISDAARRAARIVQSLLLFARREDPQQEPVTLNAVVAQSLQLKNYDFNVNNINTILELEEDLPHSYIDNHQFSQVLLNILNNAEHVMADMAGQGNIRIKTSSTEDTVLLEVSDDGPGMDTELLGRIFEPFFTTKQAGEGTGLGLSICYGIVQQHRGDMWATSQIGVGSSFFIRLPIADPTGESAESTDESIQPNVALSMRLLVVDDESTIRHLLTKGLTRDFEVVEEADSGEAALKMMQDSDYDCILLDLKMPGMGGMEVFKRATEVNPRLADRIIIMTGDTASSETAAFITTLNNAVMNKPFTLDEVRQYIKTVTELNQ